MSAYLSLEDKLYPRLLRNIKDPPVSICYRGDIGIFIEENAVAIIGARDPSEEGMSTSYYMGKLAAAAGFIVVNGLATGCDTAALQGALSVGGRCAVTLPCGMNNIYPEANRPLAEAILQQGGCVISEYPDDAPVEKWRFVERDRLQSGLSKGVVVVETKVDGGTMHTARFAIRDGRLLAAYMSSALRHDDGNLLLKERYHAIVVEGERDFDGFLTDLRFYEPVINRQISLNFGE